MKETDHQTQIKLSVKRQGGYAIKLSNRFTIGIPDLLIMLSPFVPLIAEVKDLGECVADFDRKLDVTPKQNDELKKMNAAYMIHGIQVGILLVTLRWRGMQLLVPLPQGTERLSAQLMLGSLSWGSREQGRGGEQPWYDMRGLLTVCKIDTLTGERL